MVILTIALVAYGVGALICARLLAGHLAWKWKSAFVDRPELLDWLTAGLVGVLGGVLWPALLVRRALSGAAPALPAIGAERVARQDEQQRQLTQANERLAELERETGLD